MNYEPYAGILLFFFEIIFVFRALKCRPLMILSICFLLAELKNILSKDRKRKAHESLSDGSCYKRASTFQPHFLVSIFMIFLHLLLRLKSFSLVLCART